VPLDRREPHAECVFGDLPAADIERIYQIALRRARQIGHVDPPTASSGLALFVPERTY
jgi:hypothetical protein